MLVLNRKVGEEFIINENIIIKVIAINANKVRIGIEAPSENRIVRKELLLDVKEIMDEEQTYQPA